MARLKAPPLALYIHIPWCLSKCPYCDFNSHAARGEPPFRDYLRALLEDLERDLEWLEGRRPLSPLISIFFGGGTPSLLPPDLLAELLEAISERLPLEEGVEITLEANPATLERPRLRALAEAGINRLSLGIQSFQDRLLKAIGRIHSASEAIAAVEEARESGFRALNLDLMFGLPGQTLKEGIADVERAIALSPDHISYYQLTLEPGTPFARRPPPFPPEETTAAIEEAGRERLEAAGYRRYEISAFARPGKACRHNLNYWRFGDYLGLGAGAHAKITDIASGKIFRLAKRRHPERYLRGEFLEARWEVAAREVALEFFMNRLRLREPLLPEEFEERTGLGWEEVAPKISRLCREGFLEEGRGGIACTPWGWERLNEILLHFLE